MNGLDVSFFLSPPGGQQLIQQIIQKPSSTSTPKKLLSKMSKRRMISPVVDTLVGTLPEVPEVINVMAPITSDHVVNSASVPAPVPAQVPAQQQEEVPEGNAETIVPVIDAVEVAEEKVPAATSRPIPPPLMVQARATTARKPVDRPKKSSATVDDLGDDCDDPDDGSATRPGAIRIKEMFEMAKAHGLQSAKPARALIKATFPRPDQHALAVLVMKTALEATSNQQRKRVLVRDVEPLISLLSVLSLNPSLIMPPRV